jgi:hypothetical protein
MASDARYLWQWWCSSSRERSAVTITRSFIIYFFTACIADDGGGRIKSQDLLLY